MKTRITEILGIKYPIIQGGMQWLAIAEFAAEVSNCGCMGFINSTNFTEPEQLSEEIKKAKNLTDKPFGVNISMLPEASAHDLTQAYFDVVVREGVAAVETSGRSPEEYVPLLKKAGIPLIHKVPAVRFAKKAVTIGADIVTLVGVEGGGHPGLDEVSMQILVNRASRELPVPVIAAGGIANGRAMAAALALGAEGVVVGTRLLATKECIAHENLKKWIVEANETYTTLIMKSIRNTLRAINNEAAMKVLEMEARGASLEELLTVISGKIGREAILEGDIDTGTITVGQCVGLINDIKTIRETLEDMVLEAKEASERLQNTLND